MTWNFLDNALRVHLAKRQIYASDFTNPPSILVSNSNYVLIDSSLLTETIAVFPGSRQAEGQIVAVQLPGSVGTASILTGIDSRGTIINKVEIRDSTTSNPIIDIGTGKQIYGLFHCSSTTLDGDPIGPAGSENLQISFVIFTDVGTVVNVNVNTTIDFTYNRIYSLREMPDLTFLGSSVSADIVSFETDTVANAELQMGIDGEILYVHETKTFYEYLTSGSTYIRDGLNYLNTLLGGNTRWIGIAGKYAQSIREDLVQLQNGFNLRIHPESVPDLSWSDLTLTLTVTPKIALGYSYYFYKGKYVEFSVPKTITISDVTGRHFIYIDANGVLQEIVNPSNQYLEEVIADKVYVSFVYWNKVQQKALDVGDEIHGMMGLDTHLYLQERDGTIYISGLQATVNADQDGSLNSHAQITSYSNGRIQDKDIVIDIVDGSPQQLSSPAMIPVVYRLGPNDSTGAWFIKDADVFPFIYNGDSTGFTSSDGRPAYNWFNNTGSDYVLAGVVGWDGVSATVISGTIPNNTWGLRAVSPNHIVLSHEVATHDIRHPIVSICGEGSYSTEIEGRYGAVVEVKNLADLGYEFEESVFLFTHIIQHNVNYTNTPACIIISNDKGEDSTDWRVSDLKRESTKVTDFALDRLTSLGDGVIKGLTLYTETYDGVNSYITTTNTWDVQLGEERRGLRAGSTINLTHGTDAVPVMNYVYIKNDPADNQLKLYSSTSNPIISEVVPFANFCKVYLRSAATTAIDGPASFHEIFDKLSGGTDQQSHIRHINFILRESARWKEGVVPTITVTTNAVTEDDVHFSNTVGVVRQLHLHDFPARNTATGDKIYVVNDPTTPFTAITNLNQLTQDALGTPIVNTSKITVVIWGMMDERGDYSKLYLNLPVGIYDNTFTNLDAANDISQYATYSIPEAFQGTGFLICRVTLRYTTINGGTWQILQYQGISDFEDLRSVSASGGGSSTINPNAASVPTDTSTWDGTGFLDNLDTNVQAALDTIDNYEKARSSASSEPTGYTNRFDATMTWDHPTRTMSIQPAVTQYDYWVKGKNFIETTLKTKQISTVNGLHYIYFLEDQTLVDDEHPPTDQLLKGVAFSMIVYWNNTQGIAPHVGDERHSMVMDWADHNYKHFRFGAVYISGLGLSGFTIGDGSLDSHAQFACADGVIYDEDIEHDITNNTPQQLSTILRAPVLFRVGTDLWYRTEADNFPIIYSGKQAYSGGSIITYYTGANGRPAYNQLVAGSWQLTEIGQDDLFLIHLFATNDIYYPIIAILGSNVYTKEKDAQDAAYFEIQGLGGLPFVEFTPIGSVIYQGNNTYANSVNARVIETDVSGQYYIDFRDAKTFKSLAVSLPSLTYGDYTPTLTNVSNVAASTTYPSGYQGIGTRLIVTGEVSVTTTAATSTSFRLTLPIASLFGFTYELNGTGQESTGLFGVSVRADTTNHEALFTFIAPAAATYIISYTFGYVIQ